MHEELFWGDVARGIKCRGYKKGKGKEMMGIKIVDVTIVVKWN